MIGKDPLFNCTNCDCDKERLRAFAEYHEIKPKQCSMCENKCVSVGTHFLSDGLVCTPCGHKLLKEKAPSLYKHLQKTKEVPNDR